MHRAHTVYTVHAGLKAFYVKNHIKNAWFPTQPVKELPS